MSNSTPTTILKPENKRNSETNLYLNTNLRNRRKGWKAFKEYAKSISLTTEKVHGKI